MNLKIKKYIEKNHFDLWDDFVLNKSVSGTIFHTRNFLSYHYVNRFKDSSIMIYDDSKLICVFLCAEVNDSYISHPGTSVGGLVIAKNYNTIKITNNILTSIFNYYEEFNFSIKISESIYFLNNNNQNLIYLLGQRCKLYSELSYYFDLSNINDLIDNISRRRVRTGVRKELKNGFKFQKAKTENEYIHFHKMLSLNLEKHRIKPVHTEDEFLKLSNIISKNQILFLAYNNENKIIAGVWIIKATDFTWHAQYIAQDYKLTSNYSLATLLVEIARIAKEEGNKYVNLGIVSENKGKYLNLGLADFKEALGTSITLRYLFEYEV